MKTYFTFGQDHIHRVGNVVFDKDSVAVIEAPTHGEARDIAFDTFGPEFCTSYVDLESVQMHYYPRGLIGLNCELD